MNNTATSGQQPFSFGLPNGYDIMQKIWSAMAAFPPFSGAGAAAPGVFASPPILGMPGMPAPLLDPDELDKRIGEMRAVEQWLKLNLSMLQSTIQAFEVQRATLHTLKAFGTFAQSSMTQATQAMRSGQSAEPAPEARKDGAQDQAAGSASGVKPPEAGAAFDPGAWWNLLQAQFNQIASMAMPPTATAWPASAPGPSPDNPQTANRTLDENARATSGKNGRAGRRTSGDS